MKVLIIYASAGSGHRRAAEAIYEGLDNNLKEDSRLVDILDFSPCFFRLIYSWGYTFLIKNLPFIWTFFCWATDREVLTPLFRLTRRFINYCFVNSFISFLKENNPQVIITTHFKPNGILANLRKKGELASYLISVITDYEVHSFWMQREFDAYIVAIDSAKDQLVKRGIERERIFVFGIPVNKNFLNLKSKEEAFDAIKVKRNDFCALLVTGEIGMDFLEYIALKLKDEMQTIVICGRNKRLFNRLKKLNFENLFVFSLVDNMPDFLTACDIIITKAGGLTIAESLIAGLPMFFVPVVGGQEAGNIRALTKVGAAVYDNKIKNLAKKVLKVKNNRGELSVMKKNIKELARPQANQLINSLIRDHAR